MSIDFSAIYFFLIVTLSSTKRLLNVVECMIFRFAGFQYHSPVLAKLLQYITKIENKFDKKPAEGFLLKHFEKVSIKDPSR